MTTITLYSDPDTYRAEVDVPKPAAGILKPEQVIEPDGKSYHVLRLKSASQEQRAYHVFWSDDTEGRISSILADGRRGAAGVTKTIKWLIETRIRVALSKTGFRYELRLVKDAERWKPAAPPEPHVELDMSGPGWLYDERMGRFIRPASYGEAERFKIDGFILYGDAGVAPTRHVIRHRPPWRKRA